MKTRAPARSANRSRRSFRKKRSTGSTRRSASSARWIRRCRTRRRWKRSFCLARKRSSAKRGRSWLTEFLEQIEIEQIFLPARRSLVRHERISAEHRIRLAPDIRNYAFRPRFIERDSADGRQDIDAVRCPADLKNDAGRGEIVQRQFMQRCAEARERAPHTHGILRRGTNPDVEVLCRAWLNVCTDGVRADDEELSVRVEQLAQHLGEIRRQGRQGHGRAMLFS